MEDKIVIPHPLKSRDWRLPSEASLGICLRFPPLILRMMYRLGQPDSGGSPPTFQPSCASAAAHGLNVNALSHRAWHLLCPHHLCLTHSWGPSSARTFSAQPLLTSSAAFVPPGSWSSPVVSWRADTPCTLSLGTWWRPMLQTHHLKPHIHPLICRGARDQGRGHEGWALYAVSSFPPPETGQVSYCLKLSLVLQLDVFKEQGPQNKST